MWYGVFGMTNIFSREARFYRGTVFFQLTLDFYTKRSFSANLNFFPTFAQIAQYRFKSGLISLNVPIQGSLGGMYILVSRQFFVGLFFSQRSISSTNARFHQLTFDFINQPRRGTLQRSKWPVLLILISLLLRLVVASRNRRMPLYFLRI